MTVQRSPFEGFEVPTGTTPSNVAACRSCGAPVLWVTTAAGRKAPYDRDGRSHFATCPQAKAWRQP